MSERESGADTGPNGGSSSEWLRTGSNYGLPSGEPSPGMTAGGAPSYQPYGGQPPNAPRRSRAPLAIVVVAVLLGALVALLVIWLA
jgi:hypothetical protein